MKLKLAYYGDPVLRRKGARVEEINDELRQLVDDMSETMFANNGMGLAAPQVHRSISLFITAVPRKQPDGKIIYDPVKVYINPKLSNPSEEQWEMDEGCLSLPGIYPDVWRPVKITVEATDMEGKTFIQHLHGLEARMIMHENDHLNGVLTIDRIPEKERQKFEQDLRNIKKKYAHKK